LCFPFNNHQVFIVENLLEKNLGLGTHLFVNVHRPGASEGPLRVKLPSVTTSLTTQR